MERIHHHSQLSDEWTAEDLVIVDEADCFIFSDPAAFSLAMQSTNTVCFTASAADSDLSNLEAKVLEKLGFEIYHPFSTSNLTTWQHKKHGRRNWIQ